MKKDFILTMTTIMESTWLTYSMFFQSISEDPKIADSYFIQARIVREKVIEICVQLVEDKDFEIREDKHWIYQSLAQAYLGLGEHDKIRAIENKIKEYSEGQFDMDTFLEQNKKLIELIK